MRFTIVGVQSENGLNVDLDAMREVVGFDIDRASRRLDLSILETVALSVRADRAA